MKNRRVVALNGFRRGGTSIVWNLLQSHPAVCGPGRETGEIVFGEVFRRAPVLARRLIRNPRVVRSPIGALLGTMVDRAFYARKLRNQGRTDTYDGRPYTRADVDAAFLCLKSVDEDVELTEFLLRLYPDAAFIGLVRNGYAVCNGWMRRGMSAAAAGRTYRRIAEAMLERERGLPRYRIVRFEDVLRDPFGMSASLFEYVGVQPTRLDRLRLKSKKVMSDAGTHAVRFGAEGGKYWAGPERIGEILDPAIDERQAALLTDDDRRGFEKHAAPVLARFGYA